MVNWISLAAPLAYLGILVGSLATFASLYRKRKAAKSASLEPWFGPHVQRNIYFSLLHLEQIELGKEKPVTVPESILKAALLRRATEDIHRIIAIRSAKQALTTLLARGSVGDDLWQRYQRAEQEMEAELKDVVSEANALAAGWGNHIFQSANEMASNGMTRKRVAEIQAQAKEDREWWDRKRAATKAEFLKELDAAQTAPIVSKPAHVTVAEKLGGEKVVNERVGSDEDTVLVESGGPTSPATPGIPGTPGTPGVKSGKKKKGKK